MESALSLQCLINGSKYVRNATIGDAGKSLTFSGFLTQQTFLDDLTIHYPNLPAETQVQLQSVLESAKQQLKGDDIFNKARTWVEAEWSGIKDALPFAHTIYDAVDEARTNAASKYKHGHLMRYAGIKPFWEFISFNSVAGKFNGEDQQLVCCAEALAAGFQNHMYNYDALHSSYHLTPDETALLSTHWKTLFHPDQYCLSFKERQGSCRIERSFFTHNNYGFERLYDHLVAISGSGMWPSDLFATTRSLSPTLSDENLCGQFPMNEVAKITSLRINETIRRECALDAGVAVGSADWNAALRFLQVRCNCPIQLEASFNSDRHHLVFYQNICDLCRISIDDLFAAQGESCLTPDSLFTEL